MTATHLYFVGHITSEDDPMLDDPWTAERFEAGRGRITKAVPVNDPAMIASTIERWTKLERSILSVTPVTR